MCQQHTLEKEVLATIDRNKSDLYVFHFFITCITWYSCTLNINTTYDNIQYHIWVEQDYPVQSDNPSWLAKPLDI